MNGRYRYRGREERDDGRSSVNGGSNGNGTAGWRWTIGILLTIQMAMIGYLAVRVDKMDQSISENRSTRALLEERTAVYVPIILRNRDLLNEHAREIYKLEDRIETLEDHCSTCPRRRRNQ